ncbi:endoglucanase 4 [Patella vulgata]|uniref:endoglucanase 4 n=1 Tax=Patella vulgata TaxID=6465 RepID=UPI00217FDF62|nr:endoglucanase 4 [Patella vulgata]
MGISLFLWALVAVIVRNSEGAGTPVPVDIERHWTGGFNGKFCVPVVKELSSWKADLIFDQKINSLQVWTAELTESKPGGKEFVLTNKAWNAVEHVGDQICVEFQGHGDGDISPKATVTIEGMVVTLPPTFGPDYTGTTPSRQTYKPQPTFASTPDQVTPPPGGFEIKATAPMQVFNDWPERHRVEGEFHFDGPFNGWEVKITFGSEVRAMEVAFGDVVSYSKDGTEWIIVNKMDKGLWHSGETLKMRFFANYVGVNKAPTATAVLKDMGKVVVEKLPPIVDAKSQCTKYNYDDVIRKSIMFYEAQRSGKLPKNNRIKWRGDSGLKDGSDVGVDLTGGWYDAGDHVKFGFPMAYSTAILAWGLIEWKEAYVESKQLDYMYDCIKWPLDYFLKAHVSKYELYVQVGSGGSDHGFWGRPEEMKMARPSYKIDASHPGSDVAGETCAAFAAGYLAFKDKDPKYAAQLKQHAIDLYDFGMKYKGRYTDTISAASGYYKSGNMTDELCWSSLWMYQITNDAKYLTEAEKWFQPGAAWGMSWDDTQAVNQVLLYKFTKKDIYKQAVEETFKYWMPGGTIKYTPKGLAWRLQWGSLRYSSNMAMVALMAAEAGINPEKYRAWAMSQIHYALGDTGFSYVIGFGDKYPLRPHHRSASCPWPPAPCSPNVVHRPEASVHTLFGALVGGPDAGDQYKDTRGNYINNEVATDYNAAFQGAVAALRSLVTRKLHPEQKAGTAKC